MRYEHTYYGKEQSFENKASIIIRLFPETDEEREQLRTIRNGDPFNRDGSCGIEHFLEDEDPKDIRVEFSID